MSRGVLWSLLVVVVVSGCGRNITPKRCNEPCTRTAQCEVELECLSGVCLCEVGLECVDGVCLPAADASVDGGS